MADGAVKDGPIVLVTGGDDRFAMPIGVMLFSALSHLPAGARAHIFVLSGEITAANRDRIRRVATSPQMASVRLDFVEVDLALFDGLFTNDWLNRMAYARCTLGEALPASYDKALYLDGDLIIEHDLLEVWNAARVDSECVLAVRDFGVPVGALHPRLAPAYEALGLSSSLPYFNSGFMLVDLRSWRALDMGRQALGFCARFHDLLSFADQDGLNLAIAGRVRELDARWNVQVGAIRSYSTWPDSPFKESMRTQRKALLSTAKVLHFTGVKKPWNSGLTNPVRPRFDHYLRRSCWYPGLSYASFRAGRLANNLRDIGGVLAGRARSKIRGGS